MSAQRAELVVAGRVVLAADPAGLETAEAVGIAAGRVVSAGTRTEVTDAAAHGARVIDAGEAAVIPGLHDFHIHLVGLARTRGAIALDDAADGADVTSRIAAAAQQGSEEAWLTGRGWSERQLAGADAEALDAAAGERLAFLTSHDGHSAWASPVARRLAGLGAETSDPPGGRLERGAGGEPTGILRETAMDLVAPLVTRLQGAALHDALDATLRELAALGVTGASEAGDYTDRNGIGADAALGDSYSTLSDLGDLVDGRLRLTLGIPADAVPAAAERALRTGAALEGRTTMRFGWAKEYADGALGSGTAALFEPRSCGTRDAGILRVSAEELDALFAAGRSARIGLAVHAIGDRAAAAVLDAVERAPERRSKAPSDRLEHAQLLRQDEVDRFTRLGVTASIQPIHAAADRDLVEACWDGRQDRAYAWRSLLSAGTHLAAGSDAPVESVNPWLGLFAAVHRRMPTDPRDDWRSEQALTVVEALSAYTLGPARALGVHDEGHLRPGARADLAVLSVDLDTLLAADERLSDVRAELAIIDGVEVPIS
jgi:predicted amidohydrolase YtcJ